MEEGLEAPALVILAAGLASRYGRLKQLEPVGPSGESLLDFTIHDAALTGFAPVVVVVRDSTRDRFVAHFEAHPPRADVRLVVQERDGRAWRPDGGWRPWGTGHAVLAGERHVAGDFGVANADDWYGRGSLEALAGWCRSGEGDAALIGFRLDRTLSEHGGVSRAVCGVEDGWLMGLSEHEDIRETATGITGRDAVAERGLDAALIVSMNLWGFRRSFLSVLRSAFERFAGEHAGDPAAEFRLPDAVGAEIGEGRLRVRVIESPSTWSGLTYAADTEVVAGLLRAAVAAGLYPCPNDSI